jgi:RNA polymerase sigma-32 factor
MKRRRRDTADSFDVYLAEVRQVPLLSREEERELARAFRLARDTRAAHRLVAANLRFVVQVARGYRSYGLRLADLVQEGNLGLMRAVEGYDPDRGFRLVSYAVWWIKAYIHGHILRSWSMVKLGTTQAQRRLFFTLARTQREVVRHGAPGAPGMDADALAAVARKLRVPPALVEQMGHRLSARDVSLDAPAGDGPTTRLDLLESEAPGPDDVLSGAEESAQVAGHVAAALASLDERERAIIERRVMSETPETLQALGASLGCTRERVRQLECRAKAKLREALAALFPGHASRGAPSPKPAAPRARPGCRAGGDPAAPPAVAP